MTSAIVTNYQKLTMSRLIEKVRYSLEELDNIEQAIADRLQKNQNILPQNGDSTQTNGKRPYKETLLQQHEVAFFQQQYKKQCSSILNHLNSKTELVEDLNAIDDPNYTFEKFEKIIEDIKLKNVVENVSELRYTEDIKKLYSRYSSSDNYDSSSKIDTKSGRKKIKVKRKYVLSQAADHINLDQIFTQEEKLGKQLDLLPFYDRYKVLQPESSTYLEYLQVYHEPLPEKLKEYVAYVHDLQEYLISFIRKSQPFYDVDGLLVSLDEKFGKAKSSIQDGQVNDDGLVYCKACDKLFAKESVYKGHLPGKKHKKNASPVESQLQLLPPTEKYEFMIAELSKFLSKYREAAISNAERYSSMTDREKMIEMNTIQGDELDYTTVNESDNEEDDNDDEDEDIANLKDLPLGVDGKPMPYWLFKLQGLNKSYSCEICGNISFKGRLAFDKHFGSNKHQYGLKCLGVTQEYMKLFVNIDKIEEASALWVRLKKASRIKQGDQLNAVEVEDNEGNVMSEKDYLDLKKQGLL